MAVLCVSRLDRWTSPTGRSRVIILGDAAHAIPPTAGQGINQVFEDVYMLALLLRQAEADKMLQEAMGFWQFCRQSSVDKVVVLKQQIDLGRMPVDYAVVVSGSVFFREIFDGEWLYEPEFIGIVNGWFAQPNS